MSIKIQNFIKFLYKFYILLGISNFQKSHYFNSKRYHFKKKYFLKLISNMFNIGVCFSKEKQGIFEAN